jgi:murein DD-endopeptidase MepM/ murein hydrolase activator NlpD
MLGTLLTAGARLASARRVFIAAAIALAIACLDAGAGIRGEPPTSEEQAPHASGEPVLGAMSASVPRSADAGRRTATRSPRRRGPAPIIVHALAPGEAPDRKTKSDAGPPEHIRKENVRLRRELEHLKALAAERRRVSHALNAAGGLADGGLAGSGRLIWPINGPLTSPFGPRWGRLHAGIDIAASAGTPIRAADSGRVVLAGWQGGYGLYTCVRHTPSLSTCYAHQSRLGTTNGAPVRQGEVIGYVGNTGHSFGNHLHFETWVRGQPVDPMGFL